MIVKYENFHWKKLDIFLIFAQNIDCESHNLVLEQKEKPCIPTFCYIKAGYKGVYIIRICDDCLKSECGLLVALRIDNASPGG